MTDDGQGVRGPLAALIAKVTALNEIADDLVGEFEPSVALASILTRCIDLMQCDAGSVSSVDEAAATYRKEVDIGIRCLSGHVFSLDEGMTGEVVRRRCAVWFDRYDEVAGGHLDPADRDGLGATIGTPLEWRGRIVGALVLFSRDPDRRFGAEDAQLLAMFARHAAVALANATMYSAIEAHTRDRAAAAERHLLLRELEELMTHTFGNALRQIDSAANDAGGTLDGRLAPIRTAVECALSDMAAKVRELAVMAEDPKDLETLLRAELATLESVRSIGTDLVLTGEPDSARSLSQSAMRDVLRVVREIFDNIGRHAAARTVRVLLACDYGVLRVVIQDDGRGFSPSEFPSGAGQARIVNWMRELGGDVVFESEPQWGTTVRLRFPQRDGPAAHLARVPIVVAAPRKITTAGLSRLLGWQEPSLAVVGECQAVEDVIGAMFRSAPAVTVIGHDDPQLLVAWVRRVAEEHPRRSIVAVCPSDDYDLVSETVLAGAVGCFLDTADASTAASVVVAAAHGHSVLPAFRPVGRKADFSVLTGREREVRQLLERGLANKAIAEDLVISVKTVEKHVGAILRKAGLRSRHELIARTRSISR
ncbi:LuxR C-terminal-related transcriptional regulator [Nocardioides sp. CER19]|uniref:LuxR C-terminal-related transcriptional regulator n=1 Tax=Nocardioides sp. CER19 TaxID=3038538 RepID=UPI002447DB10|nr:LuxR C-terminal-related transcriptional regulator [Nocardioides sp. CER19]MDH2416167.1 LuxR C-terminal-related transcriptional regulator [Nocardioides sp. CER19]